MTREEQEIEKNRRKNLQKVEMLREQNMRKLTEEQLLRLKQLKISNGSIQLKANRYT